MKPYCQNVSKDASAEVIWKNIIQQTLKKQKWKHINEKELLYSILTDSQDSQLKEVIIINQLKMF